MGMRLFYALLFLPLTLNATSLLVPMYSYPTTNTAMWDAVATAALTTNITTIINPFNGPGPTIDPIYTTAIASLRDTTRIGYVYASFGSREVTDIINDISAYKLMYPTITGIFLDEMSVPETYIPALQVIYEHCHQLDYTLMINPGTTLPASLLALSDSALTYEDTVANWTGTRVDTQFNQAAMILNAPANQFQTLLASATEAGYSTVYITDKNYTKLPTYWSAEVAAVPEVRYHYGIAALSLLLLKQRRRLLTK